MWRNGHDELLDVAEVACVALDTEGRMLRASTAAAALLGIEAAVLATMRLATFSLRRGRGDIVRGMRMRRT